MFNQSNLSSFFIVLFLVGILASCTKEELTLNETQDNAAFQTLISETKQKAQLSAISVAEIRNGALVFSSAEDLYYARTTLLESSDNLRQEWEEKMGFTSLLTVLQNVTEDMDQGLPVDQSKYTDIIDFSGEIPSLKDADMLYSSIMNGDAIVFLNDFLGTYRQDGVFWALDGDINTLQATIESGESIDDQSLAYLRSKDKNIGDLKTCWSSAGSSTRYVVQKDVQNGNSRGSTKLESALEFRNDPSPQYVNGVLQYRWQLYFALSGYSYRRNCCRFKSYRDDHQFQWNFTISAPSPLQGQTSFSGYTVHVNNSFAAKIINLASGYYSPSTNFIIDLETVSNTYHSTDNLGSTAANYSCN